VKALAATCAKLARLDIDEVLIGNDTLVELAQKCPDIKHLCLYTCQDIQDSGISKAFQRYLHFQESKY
jgi:hypothetical protein